MWFLLFPCLFTSFLLPSKCVKVFHHPPLSIEVWRPSSHRFLQEFSPETVDYTLQNIVNHHPFKEKNRVNHLIKKEIDREESLSNIHHHHDSHVEENPITFHMISIFIPLKNLQNDLQRFNSTINTKMDSTLDLLNPSHDSTLDSTLDLLNPSQFKSNGKSRIILQMKCFDKVFTFKSSKKLESFK